MRFGLDLEDSDTPVEVAPVKPVLQPRRSSGYGYPLQMHDSDSEEYEGEVSDESDRDSQLQQTPPRRGPRRPAGRSPASPSLRNYKTQVHGVDSTPPQGKGSARNSPGNTNTYQTPSRARPQAAPLQRTPHRPRLSTLTSRYEDLQYERSLSQKPKSIPESNSKSSAQLIVHDSDHSDDDGAQNLRTSRDYSTISDYIPTDPKTLREARWTAWRDPLEEFEREARQRSLRRAHFSYTRHASRISHHRRTTEQELDEALQRDCDAQVEEVEKMLQGMRLKQEENLKQLHKAYEERNKLLWENIDKALAYDAQIKAEEERKRKEEEDKKKAEEDRLQAEAERKRQQDEELKRRLEEEKKKQEDEARKKAEEQEQAKRAQEEAQQKASQDAASQAQVASTSQAVPQQQAPAQVAPEPSSDERIWNYWMGKLQDETEACDAVAAQLRQSMAAIETGAKKQFLNGCADLKRKMTHALSTLTMQRSTIQRVAVEVQGYFADAAQADLDAYAYLSNHYGKTVKKMAEEAADWKSIWPLAHCTKLLMTEGGQYALGGAVYWRLSKMTWFISGVKPARPEDVSEDNYDRWLGQREGEEAVGYSARISAYVALYAMICQSDVGDDDGRLPTNFTLDALWTRLTVLLRPPQDSDWLTPHAVSAIIEVAGLRMEEQYGEAQFTKLRKYLEGISNPDDEDNPHWLGREDALDTASMGRKRLFVVLESWERGKKGDPARDWVDDVDGPDETFDAPGPLPVDGMAMD